MTPPDLQVRRPHLKLALLLGVAGVLATLALSPYLMALMPLKFAALPVPLWVALSAQALQAGVLCFLLGWLGLFLDARHGLDAPRLRAWVSGNTGWSTRCWRTSVRTWYCTWHGR